MPAGRPTPPLQRKKASVTSSVWVFLFVVAAQFTTTVLAAGLSRSAAASRVTYGVSLAVSALAVVAVLIRIPALGEVSQTSLPLGLPWIGAHFRLDALSSLFLLVVNFGGAIASAYALGYGRHEDAPHRILPFYPGFLAGMNLVVLADDAFTFLLSWELMSLTSWALVVAHHRSEANRRAGIVYLVMASFGTFCLLLAFGRLAGVSGNYQFDALRALPPDAGIAGVVLVLALFGAGSKAGLVPLHVWLPLAHPAAPSHVSALMSGIMTKVAIYGFIRIVFDLIGPPDAWWSLVVLALAGLTAVMGVLYALMQHDLKRLLAYHTVENVGIIFIGLGLALAFRCYGMEGAGALALTAALLHVINHSLFKSLLFLGSGAVLTATGERDMERLGGLIHTMPHTALLFLVGSAAISALPPLNGFVSEWLTFQAILLSPQLPNWGLIFLVPAVGGLLALSAALAAACFVKAFGVTFLGRPRSEAAAQAREVDRFSLAAMYALATLCLIIGILPGPFIDLLSPVVQPLVGVGMPHQTGVAWMSIVPIAESRSSYNGLLVFVFIIGSAIAAALAIHRFASKATRRAPAWDCGAPDPNPATQYTASSFAQPIRRVFGTLAFRARDRIDMPLPGDLSPARFEVNLVDPVWDGIYRRVSGGIGFLADRLNRLQFLTIRQFFDIGFRDARASASGAGDMAMIVDLAIQGTQMLLVLMLAPLLTGVVRKMKARLTRKRGASVFQPYRDLFRLLRKEVVLAENASWLFRAAPYLIFASTWVAAALVPTFAGGLVFSWTADLIAIIALLGFGRFFLALAGMDVGTSFGGIGSSREMMIASLAEPTMLLTVFALALIAGSTQLSTVAAVMSSPDVGLRVSLGMGLVALIMVAIAENARVPVDNPATHLELTMVHEAMVLEYSGRHLALIELAASLKLVLYVSLIACIFVPWGIAAPGAGALALVLGALFYIAKIGAGAFLLGLFETTVAKMRVFRVPDFLGAALMLALLGTLLLFVSRSL